MADEKGGEKFVALKDAGIAKIEVWGRKSDGSAAWLPAWPGAEVIALERDDPILAEAGVVPLPEKTWRRIETNVALMVSSEFSGHPTP